MSGRKPAYESRATEFRRILIAWKQTGGPSLRALACELGTSHQLLSFYLKGLEQWQAKECWRQAREIRARATAEDRFMTQWEAQQARAFDQVGMRLMVDPILRDHIRRMKEESECRPLCWQEIKALKFFAGYFPEARELLQHCLRVGVQKRKRFAEIVKETPHLDGETNIAWVRRIWDECEKYDTKCPAVVTVELLQKYSHDGAKNQKNNLPVIPSGTAKSFRREST